MAMRHVVR